MNRTRLTATQAESGRKDKQAFAGKEPITEAISREDLQRCLFNEFEMGSVQPISQHGFADIPLENYDFHLF